MILDEGDDGARGAPPRSAASVPVPMDAQAVVEEPLLPTVEARLVSGEDEERARTRGAGGGAWGVADEPPPRRTTMRVYCPRRSRRWRWR